jgi:outer membrane protein OmpA-like peptidoglycan-associated protein
VSISGKVVDAATIEPVLAKISYNLLPENTNVGFTMSDSITGAYEMLIPAGSAYDYKTQADGYKSNVEHIDLLDEVDFKEIERVITLEKGKDELAAIAETSDDKKVEDFIAGYESNLILDSSVLFEFASDYLNESAYPILNKIVDFLKGKKEIQLAISGYTDNVGPAQYNISLSKRRAESVLNYFVKNGLPKTRFETKGFGFQQPIASNDTKEGRRLNRRVEFSVIKK